MAHKERTDSMAAAQDTVQEAAGQAAPTRLRRAGQTRRKWASEFQRSIRLGPSLIRELRLPVSCDLLPFVLMA
jgi:hypothetical protein